MLSSPKPGTPVRVRYGRKMLKNAARIGPALPYHGRTGVVVARGTARKARCHLIRMDGCGSLVSVPRGQLVKHSGQTP